MIIVPNTFEYNLLFSLTIILIIAKVVLSLFLLKRIVEKKKERNKFEFDFLFAIFIIILGLLLSRILYFYYDFYLTFFNPVYLHIYPNVILWKLASFISSCFLSVALFIIDRKLLNFKLKGLLAYILLGVSIVQLIYPVNTAEDFQIVSAIGLFGSLIMILLPIIFLYIGIKTPQLRLYSFLFVLGIILYFFGSVIDSEFIVAPLQVIFGAEIRLIVFAMTLLLKISGLIIMTFSSTKFYI